MAKASELGVVSVLDAVLHIFHLEGEERGEEYRIFCPNPGHPEANPSTDVNLETGYWHCYSCGVGGDLADLSILLTHGAIPDKRTERRKYKLLREEAVSGLKPHTADSLLQSLRHRLADRSRKEPKAKSLVLPTEYEPVEDTMGCYELERRGFQLHTLERWGVQWVPEQTLLNNKGKPFTLRNSVGIPIRDETGRLLNWCYRRTIDSPPWQPKYLYFAEGVSEVWFGLDHHAKAETIVIVEGALDDMWLDQHSIPGLGLLGSQMGDRKIRWLQNFKKVILLPDRDMAGLHWVMKVGNMIGTRTAVQVCTYPKFITDRFEPKQKIDPMNLSRFDLEYVLWTAKPWIRWHKAVTA